MSIRIEDYFELLRKETDCEDHSFNHVFTARRSRLSVRPHHQILQEIMIFSFDYYSKIAC